MPRTVACKLGLPESVASNPRNLPVVWQAICIYVYLGNNYNQDVRGQYM